jgi:hypothetical protein
MNAAAAQLHCADCGNGGRIATILNDERRRSPESVLASVFNRHEDGEPTLLCRDCRRGLNRNRGRARYSLPRPSDGRST